MSAQVPFDPSLPNDSNAPALLAIVGTFTAITLIIISLRIWVRVVMLKTWGLDDWCLVVAMLCGIGMLIIWVGATHTGLGRWDQYITLDMMENLQHWFFPAYIIVVLGISSVKLSVGFVLLRVVERPFYKRLLWAAIIFLILFTISCEGTLIFSCVPPAASWDFSLKADAVCFSTETFTAIGLFNSTVNIITDIFFATLPVPIIWSLNLNRKTKVTLIAVLSLGYFACAAAIVKLTYQVNTLYITNANRWSLYNLWNVIELFVGIMAAALPSLKPLFVAFLGTTKGSQNVFMGRSARNRQSHYGNGRSDGPSRHLSGVFSDSVNMENLTSKSKAMGRNAFTKLYDRPESEKSILEAESPGSMGLPLQGIVKTTDLSVTSQHAY